MKRDWQARWITSTQPKATEEPILTVEMMFITHEIPVSAPLEERLRKPALLRKSFSLEGKKVASAQLLMTAHGIYHATINGRDVSETLFAPEFTSYGKILQYQTYDVTELLEDQNVWGIVLADGWYAGRVGATGDSCQFGDTLTVLGELVITFEDGTRQVVCTDDGFECSTGKYVYSDIFIGEKQDLRLDEPGWDAVRDPSLGEAGAWEPAVEVEGDYDVLVPQEGPAVVRREQLPVASWWHEDGTLVLDFGQVIAGRVRISAHLAEGQQITLEHAEALDASGRFFSNIQGRNKDQIDVFVGRGQDETLEPDFTFHGFRFVRITGWEGEFDPACVKAFAIYSDLRETGHLVTSDERVNHLLDNIEWSQRGNMLSVPTDCPQRERMGWTGDIQVFSPTSTFFMDTEAFLRRWLASVRADQGADGQVIDYSPAPKSIYTTGLFGSYSSAGWGDAIIMVPWTLYQRYGHKDVLAENYEAMLAWHSFCVDSAAGDKDGDARYVWDTKFHYGDWMFPSFMIGPDAKGPIETAMATKDLVATAFLAYSSALLARIARELGRYDDAAAFESYAGNVRRAFQNRFYLGEGRLASDFQGPYVLALAFDLLPESERQATAEYLSQMITANGDRLDTGFLSVPYLLDVLGRFGHADQAARVFFQEGCPSWLYEVEHGATTIWESWAAVQTDGTVGAYSFNHYAFGCVGDWVVRKVGGLSVREPGFAEFDVAPAQVEELEFANLSYETAFGTIDVAWRREGDVVRLELTVPAGTIAHVTMPGEAERSFGAGSYVLCSKKGD